MSDEIKKYLSDILKAIQFIEGFVEHKRNFKSYKKDFKTKFAVERNIEIIGEAMNHLLKLTPEIPISSARNIINVRNRIIHSYDLIDDNIIWEIINTHLVTLKKEIENYFEPDDSKN